ncbi:ABC transporter permease [Streptomyces sp. NPDC101132]|uniref:ABC transporter permease n=1 Tax=Streptomyces sp. NPDC101132 TaxID=3366110 RepID=UPI0037FE5A4F
MLKTALRNLLAHKARQLMTVLAVCLGVALVTGTLVFADTTAEAHRAAQSRNFAGIAVTVTAKDPEPGAPAEPGGSALDDALVRKLSAVPGVAAVRPSADGAAVLNGADRAPLRVRTGANLAAGYVPGTDGTDDRYPLVEGRAPRNSGEVALDRATAAAGGLKTGDTVTLAVDGPVLRKRLVGTVTTTEPRVTAGGTLALFDKATAQALFAAPGRYTAIDLTAAPGTDAYELARRVGEVLPPGRAEATTGTAQAQQQAVLVDTLTRGYQKVPLVFAGVSLFIASFLIVNTFTMAVARRTREIALLRAVGASRRQVARTVLLEALLVGLAASAAGFVLGLGIAAALPTVLSTAGNTLPEGPLVIGPAPVAAALAVGVGVTLLAAWLPSRRAARIAPVEALRTAGQPPSAGRSRVRAATGFALLVLGGARLASLSGAKDASADNLDAAMLGCGLFMAGLIVLAPTLAAPVIRLTGRLTGRFGITGRLARENALRDPRRTAATAATLLTSTALVAGLAVTGHSAGQALDRQAAAGLAADYVIGSRTPTTGVDPAAVGRVAGVPGVRTASPVSDANLTVGGQVRQISGVDPATVGQVMTLRFRSGSADDLGPGRIAVSESLARSGGLTTGGTLTASIGFRQEPRTYTVVGVYQDNPVAQDALGARTEVARQAFRPGSVQRLLVRTDAGAVSATTEDRLRAAVGDSPLLKVQDRRALVDEAAGSMGDLLDVMYGMLGIGLVISALGIVNTLAVSVAERTREIGALRALGMDRAGVRRMIRLEAVTVAAYGTLLGLAGGLVCAWAVAPLASGALEHYAPSLPWGTLLLVCVASLTIGWLAAAAPAHHAARLRPLEAASDT